MSALLLALVFQKDTLYALDNHFLHRLISTKNFDYQTKPYMKGDFHYFQTDKESDDAGRAVLSKLDSLRAKSSVAEIRATIESAYSAKERCLSYDYRESISNKYNSFFQAHPDRVKELSRQDVCTLIALDIDLSKTFFASGLKRLLSGFKGLIKKDFGCLDVSIGFLRLASISAIPDEPWIHEREEWALQVADSANAMGIIAVGVRADRRTAYGIRKKQPAEIDRAVLLLQKASTMTGREEVTKSLQSNIGYLKNQKVLLLKLMSVKH